MDREAVTQKIRELGPWFHHVEIMPGLWTRDIAPTEGPQAHDVPKGRWDAFEPYFPKDMTGLNVLDIGCAEGFFSIGMARRGARVTAMDAAPYGEAAQMGGRSSRPPSNRCQHRKD